VFESEKLFLAAIAELARLAALSNASQTPPRARL